MLKQLGIILFGVLVCFTPITVHAETLDELVQQAQSTDDSSEEITNEYTSSTEDISGIAKIIQNIKTGIHFVVDGIAKGVKDFVAMIGDGISVFMDGKPIY